MEVKDKIIAEIRKIYDPELPVNIYELGLIYDVQVDDKKAKITKKKSVIIQKIKIILMLKGLRQSLMRNNNEHNYQAKDQQENLV